MDTIEIAIILYTMSLNMDYADYKEYADAEIQCIAEDINKMSDTTRNTLEMIAEQNSELLDVYDELMTE